MDKKFPVSEVEWQSFEISKAARKAAKGHSSSIIWLTGLPASGKTTIARELEKNLHNMGVHTYILDGDNMRHGLNNDLGFSRDNRKENIRRVAEVAKLFSDAGIIVICAFVSPYIDDREAARRLVEESEFVEVFVKCPLEVCMDRDPKSMYKKAASGNMKTFTGVDDPYEEPVSPEIIIETDELSLSEGVNKIIEHLKENCVINKSAHYNFKEGTEINFPER